MQENRYVRSPELMSRDDTALLVVDVQDKLVKLLPDRKTIVWNIGRLIDGAEALGIPVLATEQYPQGLGGTVEELAGRLTEIPSKLTFSCAGCEPLAERLDDYGVTKLLIVGVEAHVCVQQTVLDLLAGGLSVYVAADAVGSRNPIDYEVALRRIEAAGATVTTSEAALFEWCEAAGTPEFKTISSLVRQSPPGSP